MLILNQNTSVGQCKKKRRRLVSGTLQMQTVFRPQCKKNSVTWTTQNQRYDEAGLDLRPSSENLIKVS
jgi:hypothetical protein